MARCKFCDQPIDWIYCPEEGRSVPVDEEPVFVDLSGGRVKFISDEGAVLWGRLAGQETPPADVDVAFIPHRCLMAVYQN